MKGNAIQLINFLERYPEEWHSYATDVLTLKVLKQAMALDPRIELSDISNQMRLTI
jgi:hypothetical protein